MTLADITELALEYRAGIEAELHLLRRLDEVSSAQHSVGKEGAFAAFGDAADERDRIMWNLVTIEQGLRAVRRTLADHPDLTSQVEGFDDVVALHRSAVELVNKILEADQKSLAALADAELTRRSAVAGLERGETTLAAYRRVLVPTVTTPSLVNKRG